MAQRLGDYRITIRLGARGREMLDRLVGNLANGDRGLTPWTHARAIRYAVQRLAWELGCLDGPPPQPVEEGPQGKGNGGNGPGPVDSAPARAQKRKRG